MNEWESSASLVYLLTLGITSNVLISEWRPLNKLNLNLLLVRLGAGGWTQVRFWDAGGTMSQEHKTTPPRKWALQWLKGWDSERKLASELESVLAEGLSWLEALEKDSEWKFKGKWDGTESKAELALKRKGREVWDGTERGGADWGNMKVRPGRTRGSSRGIWTYLDLLEKKSRSDI